MSDDTIQRPSLGQSASLGILYDARREAFTEHLILSSSPSEDIVIRTETEGYKECVTNGKSLKEKFKVFGITSELGASYLTGLVSPQGAARYLDVPQSNNNVLEASLYIRFRMEKEELDFDNSKTRSLLNKYSLDDRNITHVVSKIIWGAQTVITLRHQISSEDDRADIEQKLRAELDVVSGIIRPDDEEEESDASDEEDKEKAIPLPKISPFGQSLEVAVLSDLEQEELHDLSDVYNFCASFEDNLYDTWRGRGVPIIYSLLPLHVFMMALPGLRFVSGQ